MTRPRTHPADPPRRRITTSEIIERLTEKRTATSTASLKVTAQGRLIPEVTVAAGDDHAAIAAMCDELLYAFNRIAADAAPPENGTTE